MYNWKLQTDDTTFEGCSRTLNAAIDNMVKYANGGTERDFYINGHHMNEEFGLWIDDGKVIHDNGADFVPMNKWYDLLGGGDVMSLSEQFFQSLKPPTPEELERIFRPQPTRGSAPTNAATLVAKGMDV